jgi:hypothetical protein
MIRLILITIFLTSFVQGAAAESSQPRIVDKPARVTTSMVKRVAIVEAVNKTTRELKLIDSNGNRFTIVADDLVRNFDQIRPRDRIITEYLESVAILVAPSGATSLGDGIVVEVAAEGQMPGFATVDTVMVKATITALNVTQRLATLSTEDGTTKTVLVGDDVPLHTIEVGDEVRLRLTTAVAISVVRPD